MEVRFLEITSVQPEHLALWESWLAPEKRQRIDRLPERKRLLSLCGDGLAREMLSEKLGISAEEISFDLSECKGLDGHTFSKLCEVIGVGDAKLDGTVLTIGPQTSVIIE